MDGIKGLTPHASRVNGIVSVATIPWRFTYLCWNIPRNGMKTGERLYARGRTNMGNGVPGSLAECQLPRILMLPMDDHEILKSKLSRRSSACILAAIRCRSLSQPSQRGVSNHLPQASLPAYLPRPCPWRAKER